METAIPEKNAVLEKDARRKLERLYPVKEHASD
jgi:hypothetical protein